MKPPNKQKYIKTPEKLLELFEVYRKDVKDNPRKKHTFVGKEGRSDYELLERPLTLSGFRAYCYTVGFTVHHYFNNTNNSYEAYRSICMRILDEIRNDQIEGGSVGQYNASITQRLNGLTDKQEIKMEEKITELNVNVITTKKDSTNLLED